MSMRTRAEEYLALRRSLGRKMHGEGRMLLDFAGRMDSAGQLRITVTAALQWATEPKTLTPEYWRHRLSVVRGFACHLNTFDPASEIPPVDLIVAPSRRKPPYVYSSAEIAALVHTAGTITAPLPAASIQALISLIAASGLRLGEALGLDRHQVGLPAAMLTVTGKNDQARLVPLHPTTVTMLTGYATRRDRLCPDTASPAFFITRTGQRIQQRWVQETFARLLALASIQAPPGRRRPRIHDLRHTFAVDTLIGWYRAGINVQARLPVLSTFLGHSSTEATYWYLQAVPELLGLAAQRLEPGYRPHTHPCDEEPGRPQ
jgi:integrase/recombinase XerD